MLMVLPTRMHHIIISSTNRNRRNQTVFSQEMLFFKPKRPNWYIRNIAGNMDVYAIHTSYRIGHRVKQKPKKPKTPAPNSKTPPPTTTTKKIKDARAYNYNIYLWSPLWCASSLPGSLTKAFFQNGLCCCCEFN